MAAARSKLRSPDIFVMQELLWEAARPGTEAGDGGVLSPETAAVKRASALESRRFLDAIAENEAEARKRRSGLFDGGDGGDSSAGEEESDAPAPVSLFRLTLFDTVLPVWGQST